MLMKKYQYQVLRYLPDRISGEFINIGVVLYCPEERYLKAKVVEKIGRLSSTFDIKDSHSLLRTIKFIRVSFQHREKEVFDASNGQTIENLATITNLVLPKDDSSLFFTEVKLGLDMDCDKALEDLYYRMTKDSDDIKDMDIRKDAEVWSKIYKDYFQEAGIIPHLKKHTVTTQTDEISFDRAWKNGSWHCFEPLSFNLQKIDSIKNKVYRWAGKIQELDKSEEAINLILLTKLPSKHHQLNDFIQSQFDIKRDNLKVTLVNENEAEGFVKNLQQKIESSLLINT